MPAEYRTLALLGAGLFTAGFLLGASVRGALAKLLVGIALVAVGVGALTAVIAWGGLVEGRP